MLGLFRLFFSLTLDKVLRTESSESGDDFWSFNRLGRKQWLQEFLTELMAESWESSVEF